MSSELIKNKGIKVTKHKLAVLELFNVYKHLDALQIFTLLSKKGVDISQATIYRILAKFEEANIIVKHNFHEDQSIYELFKPNEHHDHLICIKCNEVVEFFDFQIEQIQARVVKENKFTMLDHSLTIYGVCEKCSALIDND